MKRYLMVFLVVLLFSTAASAQVNGYLCLFADVDHSVWCGTAPSIPGQVTMYVFMLPEAGGSFGAEFQCTYPNEPTWIFGGETYNAEILVVMGSLANGVSLGFDACKTDWYLIATQPIVTFNTNPGTVSIVPHPTSGGPSLADCGPQHDKYPAVIFNNLYINYPPGSPECSETATANATWGAIKGMYVD